MSSADLAEMKAYVRLVGPLGPERDDWRFAMIAATIANANRDAKKHRQPYKPDDFIPDWAKAAGVQKPLPAPAEVASKVKAFFSGLPRRK